MNWLLTIIWIVLAAFAVLALTTIGERTRDIAAILHAQNLLLKHLLEELKDSDI